MRRKNVLGLDLIKTIAIISVVFYHINSKMFPGGFIGVDLFFVLSGYLLTSSLVKQHNEDRNIKFFKNVGKRLKQFWPSIFILSLVTIVFITLFNKPVLEVSHKDVIPANLFSANWWFIYNKVGYFDSFTTSPFKHLWYIAVLMQAQILIIFLFKGFYSVKIFKKYDVFIVLMGIIGIASFAYENYIFSLENISRVYYGTDTRIYTIIIGVLGYFYNPIESLQNKRDGKTALYANIASIVSLAIFIYFVLNTSEMFTWVYRVGFLAFALNSLVMVYSFGAPVNIFAKLANYIPYLLDIGRMSYSIYLWHFPIISLTKLSTEAGNPNLILTAIRIVVFMLLSSTTYNFLEKPLRRKTFREYFSKINFAAMLKSYVLYLFLGIFALGMFGVAFPFLSTAFVDTTRDVKLQEEIITSNNAGKNAETKSQESLAESAGETVGETIEETQSALASQIKYKELILVGDSIGVNVGNALLEEFPSTTVDAKVSRQLYNSKDIFVKYKGKDSKDTALIVMLGSNGIFKEKDLDDITAMYPSSKIVFVNIKAPVSWEQHVNKLYAEYVKKDPRLALVDWYSIATKHPEYLGNDQVHLMQDGIDALLEAIIKELSK